MQATSPPAGKREWLGLGVIAIPCLLYSMDLTVLNLAVPSLSADLKPSSTQLLWIVDVYGFLVAGSLITMGTLGDRIGRRRLLLIGAASFGIASLFAAFSRSAEMLILTRALLGLAGATLAPSTMSLIRNMFLDPRQRSVAIGVWISSFSAGAAIGPPLGGFLLEYFWWGSVFLISVPVMVMILLLGPMLLPEFRDPEAGRADLISAFLSLSAVLGVIYGLKRIAAHGFGWLPALTIAVGLAMGAVFIRRQRQLADPLIDLRLFRAPGFSSSLAIYLLATFAVLGPYVFIAQYLQLVLGLSPLRAGLWTIPFAGGFVFGSMLSPFLGRRIRPTWLMTAGLVIAGIGFAMLGRVNGSSGLEIIATSTLLFSLGLSPVFTFANDMIIGAAPPERAGAASAISETCSELGGALGIAILGSIGIAAYRQAMDGSIPPEVPSDLAESARDTLASALAAATQLPEQTAARLLEAARAAFTLGLQITAVTSAVVVLAMAFAIFIAKRSHTMAAGTWEPPANPPSK